MSIVIRYEKIMGPQRNVFRVTMDGEPIGEVWSCRATWSAIDQANASVPPEEGKPRKGIVSGYESRAAAARRLYLDAMEATA